MQYRISREQALKSFIDLISSKEGFKEELNKHPIALSSYMYLTKDNIQEFKSRIKKYHMDHKRSFLIVDNEENLTKFNKNGLPASAIVISENSSIIKTSLGKFDEKKLIETLLLSVSDVYKFDPSKVLSKEVYPVGLKSFDKVVTELNLHGMNLVDASHKVLSAIIKLALQIRKRYGLQVCNKENTWSFIKDKDGVITDTAYEIHEKFVANNHTETIDRYSLYARYFDLITYMIEVLEYKLKKEVEDPESIKELYYKNLSQYANGYMYTSEELSEDKFKIVRSKISIGPTTRIKNLKDYLGNMIASADKSRKDTIIEVIKQVDTLAELAKAITTNNSNAVDNSKLLTQDINFVDKTYVEEHLSEPEILKYQTELNKLLDMVSELDDEK